jgi:glycosyltransferase involved in cell wall biosynthesis
MKIGITVSDVGQEVGGGYTFEQEIFAGLAGADVGNHSFIAIGHGATPPEAWTGAYISPNQPIAARIRGRVRRTLARSTTSTWRPPPAWRFDEVIDASGIDLIWHISGLRPTNRLPFITTVWDIQHRIQPVFPEVGSTKEWTQREAHYSRELGQAAVVIVGTEAGRDEVERIYGVPPGRIRKLPHPTPSFAIDAGPSDAGSLGRLGLEPGYVLYPAQFWPHKNHVAILRALAWLRDERDVMLHAVFVGSDKGNERHVRRETERLGLSDAIHFLGFVPRADLVALYRNALALAYVTFFGPENLPPLEAFALGCPVAASAVNGSEEQLGDAALLVEPTNHVALGNAILQIRSDPDIRKTLIERGLERARRFTKADYVRGMVAILDELEPVIRTWR